MYKIAEVNYRRSPSDKIIKMYIPLYKGSDDTLMSVIIKHRTDNTYNGFDYPEGYYPLTCDNVLYYDSIIDAKNRILKHKKRNDTENLGIVKIHDVE
jgi:hypothetical protein